MGSAFDLGNQLNDERFGRQMRDGYEVRISDYISEGWRLFRQTPWEFIGYTALVFLINFAAALIPFGAVLVSAPLIAGFFYRAFRMMRNEPTDFSDFFRGFNYWLPLVLASVLIGIFTFIGILLVVLPGIYLAVAYAFATPLIIDKRMFFWQSMEVSRKVITKKWFSLFGLVLLLGLINIAGALLLVIPLLVTVPWTICAQAAAFKDIIGLEPAAEEEQTRPKAA